MIDHTKHDGWPRIPQRLATFVADIAKTYAPRTVIDPCCVGLEILRCCDFVATRRALFRDALAFEDAEKQTDVQVEFRDIIESPVAETYDAVIGLLPVIAREAVGEKKRFLTEELLERSLDLVAPGGVCVMLIESSILTSDRFAKFRSRVLNSMALDAVIEFSERGVSLSMSSSYVILILRNTQPRPCGTFMAKLDTADTQSILTGLRDGVGHFFVPPDNLATRWDRHFHDPKHQQIETMLGAYDTKRLVDLGAIRSDSRLRSRRELLRSEGEFLVLQGRHFLQNSITRSDRDQFVDRVDAPWFSDAIVKPGDVVIRLYAPFGAYVYTAEDPPAVCGDHVAVLRTKDNDYVSSYLNTPDGQTLFREQALRHSRGSDMHRLSRHDLELIRIPILPIADLNSFGDTASSSASKQELEAKLQTIRAIRRTEFKEAELESWEAELKIRAAELDASAKAKDSEFELREAAASAKDLEQSAKDLEHGAKDLEQSQKETWLKNREDTFQERLAIMISGAMHAGINEMKAEIRTVQDEVNAEIRTVGNEVKVEIRTVGNDLRALVTSLVDEFRTIKNGGRDVHDPGVVEQLLKELSDKLDKCSNAFAQDALEKAELRVKVWLTQWDSLHTLSQRFLPSAEHLFEILKAQSDADFSPFILQYCRAFENEILQKLFVAYHVDVNARVDGKVARDQSGNRMSGASLREKLKSEATTGENKKKLEFVRFVERLNAKDDKYTLEDMKRFINISMPSPNEGSNYNKSDVLKDFREFVSHYFDEYLDGTDFLTRLDTIKNEFRNESAHPYEMGRAKADRCIPLVQKALKELLDAYEQARLTRVKREQESD